MQNSLGATLMEVNTTFACAVAITKKWDAVTTK